LVLSEREDRPGAIVSRVVSGPEFSGSYKPSRDKAAVGVLSVAEITGAIGIVFLFAYRFTGKKMYARYGQVFLIGSFGLIAFMLLTNGNFWVGSAFAAAVVIQLYSAIRTLMKKSTHG
jgi:Ca2+/Na+ antiporter